MTASFGYSRLMYLNLNPLCTCFHGRNDTDNAAFERQERSFLCDHEILVGVLHSKQFLEVGGRKGNGFGLRETTVAVQRGLYHVQKSRCVWKAILTHPCNVEPQVPRGPLPLYSNADKDTMFP